MIIAEMETRVPTLSVGDAVMQMELSEAPVLVFRNEGTDGVNVVSDRLLRDADHLDGLHPSLHQHPRQVRTTRKIIRNAAE